MSRTVWMGEDVYEHTMPWVHNTQGIFYRRYTMGKLWQAFLSNLSFVAVCTGIIIGLFLLAKLSERFLPNPRKTSQARRIAIIAICSALASVLHF